MLNFVIAILSSTYSNFEHIQSGLYYNVLIQVFPAMGWDDEFGCLVCAQTPFNMIGAFFSPFLVMSQVHDRLFYYTNEVICLLLYFPFVCIIWTIFNICNLIFLPISYVIFTIRLLISIFEQEDLLAAVKRFSFLILYIFLAPIFLMITFAVDFFVFFGNLFTQPLIDEFKTNKHKVFKKESLKLFEDTINEMINDLAE
jgi:hypothetical protein